MRITALGALVFAGMIIAQLVVAQESNPYVGFWELTFDEDGTPKDTMEIRGDGTYVSHGWTCQRNDIVPYHVYGGNMYATIEVSGKGPIAIIFRHNQDGRLSFTSPRTRKNAYYSRLEENPCPRDEA